MELGLLKEADSEVGMEMGVVSKTGGEVCMGVGVGTGTLLILEGLSGHLHSNGSGIVYGEI